MSNKYIADYQRKELRGPVTMEKPLNYGLYELGEHRGIPDDDLWKCNDYAHHLNSLPVAFPAPWLEESDDGKIKELGKDFAEEYQIWNGHKPPFWITGTKADYEAEEFKEYKRIIAVPISQDKQQEEELITVFVACNEEDNRAVGVFTSTNGMSLCYVREMKIKI